MNRAVAKGFALSLAVLLAAGVGGMPVMAAETVPTAQVAPAERSVNFTVDRMTCAACPITVRKAMERVDGVKSVSVDFATRSATVVFDPAQTTPEEIAAASARAGYPATPTS